MKSLSCLLALVLVQGCSMVSCDRVFPKLAWYWSKDAKACREARARELAMHTNQVDSIDRQK